MTQRTACCCSGSSSECCSGCVGVQHLPCCPGGGFDSDSVVTLSYSWTWPTSVTYMIIDGGVWWKSASDAPTGLSFTIPCTYSGCYQGCTCNLGWRWQCVYGDEGFSVTGLSGGFYAGSTTLYCGTDGDGNEVCPCDADSCFDLAEYYEYDRYAAGVAVGLNGLRYGAFYLWSSEYDYSRPGATPYFGMAYCNGGPNARCFESPVQDPPVPERQCPAVPGCTACECGTGAYTLNYPVGGQCGFGQCGNNIIGCRIGTQYNSGGTGRSCCGPCTIPIVCELNPCACYRYDTCSVAGDDYPCPCDCTSDCAASHMSFGDCFQPNSLADPVYAKRGNQPTIVVTI